MIEAKVWRLANTPIALTEGGIEAQFAALR